jgi:hypothetical protein
MCQILSLQSDRYIRARVCDGHVHPHPDWIPLSKTAITCTLWTLRMQCQAFTACLCSQTLVSKVAADGTQEIRKVEQHCNASRSLHRASRTTSMMIFECVTIRGCLFLLGQATLGRHTGDDFQVCTLSPQRFYRWQQPSLSEKVLSNSDSYILPGPQL